MVVGELRQGEAEAVRWRQWLEDIRSLAPSTLSKYTRIIIAWLDWCQKYGQHPLGVDVEHIEHFIARKHYRTGKVRSAHIRALECTVLGLWYNWMHKRGIMTYDPCLDLRHPEIREKDPECMLPEHWQQLWAYKLSPYERASLGFAYYCGLRVSELIWLPPNIIGPREIRQLLRKGGEYRNVPWLVMVGIISLKLPMLLPDPDLMTGTVEYVRMGIKPVSPWRSDEGFRKGLKRLCVRAGVPEYTPHSLRKSACTNLLDAGVEIQDVSLQMNHKDIKTTMRYYAGNNQRLLDWFRRQLAA